MKTSLTRGPWALGNKTVETSSFLESGETDFKIGSDQCECLDAPINELYGPNITRSYNPPVALVNLGVNTT